MAKPRLITRFINIFFRHFLYRVKYENAEVLDKYTSYVIAPSHSCVFDPVFVFPIKYDTDISIVAKKEMFKYAWFRYIAKKYSVFPIDRENVDVRSMLKTIDVFKESDTTKLILFPEGKVVKDENEIGKVYKKGAAFVAYHLEKPIIPVYISRRPKFFSQVTVIYGEPFFISKDKFKGKEKFDEASKMIIDEIYKLKK